jgi:protein farnesyltransferase subunit beta
VKYLLSCCQHPDGGLRDKPPMRSDFYHSCYSLAGLSVAQYHYQYDPEIKNDHDDDVAFKWTVSDFVEGDIGDRVEKVHPIFVTPWGSAEKMRAWFVKKDGKPNCIPK